MTTLPPLMVATYTTILATRCAELWVSRRHERRLRANGATPLPRDGLLHIAAAQSLVLVGSIVEVAWAPWAGVDAWTGPFLVLALFALALRYWAAVSLRDRYTVRVWRVVDPLVTVGPYRWLRHPIYRAVTVEVAALAFAFGAWIAGTVGTVLHLLALRHRIRREESVLPSQTP